MAAEIYRVRFDNSGIMQADAYTGYNELYEARRRLAPVTEAACWAHGRRKFFELGKLTKAPVPCEAVRRIDELFEIEREINGSAPEQRLAVRREKSKPLVDTLETWLREQRDRVSANHRPGQLEVRRLECRRAQGGCGLHADRDSQMNDVDPQAWLAHVLAKLPAHPAKRIDELLPWNWKASQQAIAQAA